MTLNKKTKMFSVFAFGIMIITAVLFLIEAAPILSLAVWLLTPYSDVKLASSLFNELTRSFAKYSPGFMFPPAIVFLAKYLEKSSREK